MMCRYPGEADGERAFLGFRYLRLAFGERKPSHSMDRVRPKSRKPPESRFRAIYKWDDSPLCLEGIKYNGPKRQTSSSDGTPAFSPGSQLLHGLIHLPGIFPSAPGALGHNQQRGGRGSWLEDLCQFSCWRPGNPMEIRFKQLPRVPICCMPSPLPSFQGYFEELRGSQGYFKDFPAGTTGLGWSKNNSSHYGQWSGTLSLPYSTGWSWQGPPLPRASVSSCRI